MGGHGAATVNGIEVINVQGMTPAEYSHYRAVLWLAHMNIISFRMLQAIGI